MGHNLWFGLGNDINLGLGLGSELIGSASLSNGSRGKISYTLQTRDPCDHRHLVTCIIILSALTLVSPFSHTFSYLRLSTTTALLDGVMAAVPASGADVDVTASRRRQRRGGRGCSSSNHLSHRNTNVIVIPAYQSHSASKLTPVSGLRRCAEAHRHLS